VEHYVIRSTTDVPSTSTATTLQAPGVIHEYFTLLSCSPGTTIGLEGCSEHQLLMLDARIVASQRNIFSLLRSRAARGRFAIGTREWLLYRRSTCLVASDAYEGGTLAPVTYANCLVLVDHDRLDELATTLESYAQHEKPLAADSIISYRSAEY